MDVSGSLASAAVPLCPGLNVAERTFSANVYIPAGSPAFNAFSFFFVDTWNSAEGLQNPVNQFPVAIPLGQWTPVSCTLGQLTSTVADHVSFRLNNNSSYWAGTIYVDDITIN
jgi:hypothetical protein